MNAQTPFARTVGGSGNDQGHALVQLADSSFVVAGQTNSFGAGGQDIYVVRFNQAGKLIWTRTFGGTGNDYARSMVLGPDGSVVMAGVSNSFGAGSDDVYIVNIDSSGTVLWTRTYGGSGDDRAWKIIRTADDGYAVAGISNSSPAKGQDMYLLKLDASGEKQWERLVDGNSSGPANYTDIGYALTQLNNGHIVLFGTAAMPGSFTVELFLSCFDPDGNNTWSKIITQPHTGSNFNDYAKSVIATSDGGFVIGAEAALPCETGWVECNSPGGINWHYYISKFDALGNNAWSKFFGGGTVNGVSADGSDYLREIIRTADGGYAVCGHSYAFRKDFATNAQKGTEYFVLKLDASGEPQWSKVIGTETLESGQAIIQAYGGGYVIAGFTSPASGPANDQLSIFSLDASGNACLPVRTGGKLMGSGGGTSNLGTIALGQTLSNTGGATGSGGTETDLCAGQILVQAEVLKSCFDACSGRAAVQASGGTAPYSYLWLPGNLSGNTVENLCPGDYTVQISDQGGNTATYTLTVGTEDTLLQLSLDGPAEFCEGTQRIITAAPGHSLYTWNGIPGGNTLSTGASGTYIASAVSGAGCTLHSDPVTITVNPKPEAAFSYEQLSGYTLRFTDESTHTSSWNWQFPAGPNSQAQNPEFTFPFDGTYPVRLIVSNDCGSDTLNLDVEVRKINGIAPGQEMLAGFRHQQDGQTLYFSGRLIRPGKYRFLIQNLSGQLLANAEFSTVDKAFELSVDASRMALGMYFFLIETDRGLQAFRFTKN